MDTEKVHKVKQALNGQAQSLELQLLKDGAKKTSELQRKVPGLKRAVGRYKNLTDTDWLTKVYKHKFLIESGKVKVKLKRPGSAAASSSGSASLMPLSAPPIRDGGS